MSDDLETRREAFLRELDELDGQGEGNVRTTVAKNKDKVFGLLAALGVKRLSVPYDGSGDEGVIEGVVCRGPADAVIELPAQVREAVEGFVCESLPSGWEINEGSYGSAEFDIEAGKVRFWHAQRVIEIFENEWEE